MAKKTVTVCDVCGVVLEDSEVVHFGPYPVGTVFDGEKKEEEAVTLDLCQRHSQLFRAALITITGELSSTHHRIFTPEQATAVMVLCISECSTLWRKAS